MVVCMSKQIALIFGPLQKKRLLRLLMMIDQNLSKKIKNDDDEFRLDMSEDDTE